MSDYCNCPASTDEHMEHEDDCPQLWYEESERLRKEIAALKAELELSLRRNEESYYAREITKERDMLKTHIVELETACREAKRAMDNYDPGDCPHTSQKGQYDTKAQSIVNAVLEGGGRESVTPGGGASPSGVSPSPPPGLCLERSPRNQWKVCNRERYHPGRHFYGGDDSPAAPKRKEAKT